MNSIEIVDASSELSSVSIIFFFVKPATAIIIIIIITTTTFIIIIIVIIIIIITIIIDRSHKILVYLFALLRVPVVERAPVLEDRQDELGGGARGGSFANKMPDERSSSMK
eukprot:TRINITY_DN3110_c0_g1_i2.p2 TRINITY_DN3110_c0_g1~~TRINITY_DN3110_c0_g1_i2.p2  ORF type:complete len:111 (-),score=35.97 TRINITY_DN3110_c0_g1_i2:451-783(-)